jgi:hypothetical protein
MSELMSEDSGIRSIEIMLSYSEREGGSRAHSADVSDTYDTPIDILPREEMFKIDLLVKIGASTSQIVTIRSVVCKLLKKSSSFS